MWLVGTAIFGIRCLLIPLALFVLWRSSSGPVALWRGKGTLTQHNRAQVFFFACAVLLGQTFYLFVPTPPLLLLALLLSLTSLSLASAFFLRKSLLGVDIAPVIDQLDLSLPLVQLAELDPEAAQELASQARQRLAQRRAGK